MLSDPALEPVDIRFDPGPAYAQGARNWQGIPGLERAANGRLWATWYTGGRTEDAHNHVVLVTSDDNGRSWSEPVLAIDPPGDIRASDSVLWLDPLGRLWLFWMQTAHCGRTFDGRAGVWAIRCPDASDPRPAWTAPRRIANGIMMNKPTVLSTGEWLLPTAVWSHGAPYRLHLPDEAYANVTLSRDQGETFSLLGSADVPLRGPDEHMIVERRDDSLWMLVRRKDGIGEAVSRDRGATWEAAPGVVIPGPGSRFHIRRLRSGRLLLINHVDFTGRSHLTALLSDDDGVSWPHRLLLDERRNVSYPDAVETPSGEILVIYDRDRTGEGEILMQRFTEADVLEQRQPGIDGGRLQVISRIERPSIGTRRELLVDEWLIDHLDNTHLHLHAPERREVALVTDRPWEGNLSGYITVFRDGDRFRMYYKGYQAPHSAEEPPVHPCWICYAESVDGIRWERPDLGLYPFQGSRKNNIVFTGIGEDDKGAHGFAPFRDDNPACPPEQRYKAVGGLGPDGKTTKGDLYALASPDGIHWSLLREKPILLNRVHGYFDSQNQAFWDAHRGEYRIYFRDYINQGQPGSRRAIKTARSTDFLNWTDATLLDYPGAPPEQLYTNQVQPYDRAPHLLLGFPARYVERAWSPSIEALPELKARQGRAALSERYGAALTDGLFMSSRDGVTFHRWGEAFIRPGPQRKGNWAYGDNYQSLGLFETPSDLPGAPNERSFLVTENAWREPATLFRRHAIRVDGFVSVRAPLAGGQVSFKPLRFAGTRLFVNAATSAAGSVRAQIEDSSGHPIEGFALADCHDMIGDDLDREIRWCGNAKLGALAGRLVRIRFALTDADLYSFRFQ